MDRFSGIFWLVANATNKQNELASRSLACFFLFQPGETTLSVLALTTARETTCRTKSALGAPILALSGGNFQVVLSKALEQGSGVGSVGCGVRIVDDDVVKESGDAFENLFFTSPTTLTRQPEAALLPCIKAIP